MLRRIIADRSGLATYEYALVLLLFSMVMVLGFQTLSQQTNTNYNASTSSLTTLQETAP